MVLNMKKAILFILALLMVSACSSDTKKTEEGKEEIKTYSPETQAIIDQAPITIDYETAVPPDSVSDELKAFAGHWVGKWNNGISSQIVVTKISGKNVEFIYSWGKHPEGNFGAGQIKLTAKVIGPGKVKYDETEILTLEYDKNSGKLMGVHDNGTVQTTIELHKAE